MTPAVIPDGFSTPKGFGPIVTGLKIVSDDNGVRVLEFQYPEGFLPDSDNRCLSGFAGAGAARGFSTPKGFCPIVTCKGDDAFTAQVKAAAVSVPRRVFAR